MKSFQAQTYYELLEISVGATREEIRNAHERLSRLYSDDQVALYGLIEPGQAAVLRDRLEEALEVLSDEPRRATYDASIGLPPREVLPPLPPRPTPAPVLSRALDLPSASGPCWSGISWVTPEHPAPPLSSPPQLLVIDAPGGSHSGMAAAPLIRAPSVEAPRVEAPRVEAPIIEASIVEASIVEASIVEAPIIEASIVEASNVEASIVEAPAPQADSRSPPAPAIIADLQPAPSPGPPPPAEPGKPQETSHVGVAPTPEKDRQRLPEPHTEVIARPRDFRPGAKVKPFEVGPAVEFNGDLIRQVRMARGISLVQLAEKTRISVRHLENLEADRYDSLPAAVYLRGILVSVARELGLDGGRVSRSYLSFVEARRAKG